METNQQQGILFADITGSTRLYERLGDQAARAAIADCLTCLQQVVEQHGGRVVKTIGDELMCAFPGGSECVAAAREMQEQVSSRSFSGVALKIRVGAHYGPVIEEHGDLFGDAVNVAARMAGIARGGQIVVTEDCVARVPESVRGNSRLIDRAPVKGKAEPVNIFEVVWEKEGVTHIMQAVDLSALESVRAQATLVLMHAGGRHVIHENQPPTVLGREPSCDLVLRDATASRQHARIEFRRGKFILVDQSTNGTYVRLADGQLVFLKREELPLWGTGEISAGDPELKSVLRFEVESPADGS